MNIFYLDHDPDACTKLHCDKHVVKMIVETAQLLSTAHHQLSPGDVPEGIYKETHKNHPSAVWARQSSENYMWLWRLGMALCVDYTRRYGRIHKTQAIMETMSVLPHNIPIGPFFEPPACMPDELKQDDVISSYKNYYRIAKSYMAKWKDGGVPSFMLLPETVS